MSQINKILFSMSKKIIKVQHLILLMKIIKRMITMKKKKKKKKKN